MRKPISVSAGCLIAAVLTHGLVSSGLNLTGAERLSFFSYRGFFSNAIFGLWRLWTLAHGDVSTSILNGREHGIDTFGRLFAVAVLLTLPLLGFTVSAFSSRQRISWHWLRPLAIASALALWDVLAPIHFYELRHLTMRQVFLQAGFSMPFAESARAVLVTLLLLWSAGLIRVRKLRGPEPIRDMAPA